MITYEKIRAFIEDDGGFTFHPSGLPVRTGYAVSKSQEYVVMKNMLDIDSNRVYYFINRQIDYYYDAYRNSSEPVKLGGWYSDRKLYIEVTYVYKTKKEAIKIAKEHNQIAIYDLKNKKEIEIK